MIYKYKNKNVTINKNANMFKYLSHLIFGIGFCLIGCAYLNKVVKLIYS